MFPTNYSTLQLKPDTVRLARLLPPEKNDIQIKCELFNYSLPERSDRKHPYEALSYVWGSEMKPNTIILNGSAFSITQNLYTALTYLRHPQLERTIWVDAICINQDDDDEKSIQIPLMRAIYAQANRVIVWLGEAMADGDKALKTIHYLAEDKSLQDKSLLAQNWDTSEAACLRLLQREWFQRIWVLQEVGVARCISIICGSVEVNGHIFCEGLSNLRHSVKLPRSILPVLSLIRGALFRPSYDIDSHGTLAIGELLDMYRNHNATKPHDKVYALLGLSKENTDKAGLKPNYRLQWNEVFKQVAMHIFPSSCSVETWPGAQVAVIKGKGWILGYVDSVEEGTSKYGHQQINVIYNDTAHQLGCQSKWGTQWTLQASAESIHEGNIICLLQGASSPTILKLCNDRFTVIVSTTKLQPHKNIDRSDIVPAQNDFPIQGSLNDIYITWEIPLADRESNSRQTDQGELITVAPRYQEEAFEKAKRLHDISLIIDNIMIQVQQRKHPTDRIRYLLLHRGESLPVSEDVVKAAAANEGKHGHKVMQQLLEHCGRSLPVSEDVIKTAAANEGRHGEEIMQQLLEHSEKILPVSEDVVKAAAANKGEYGHEIMQQLLQRYRGSLPLSEDMIKTAAANEGEYGHGIIHQLLMLYRRGYRWGRKSLLVSEDVIKTAAANEGEYGHLIIQYLLEHCGEKSPVSEDVAKAAAANEGKHGHKIMQQLLKHYGKSLPVSKDVVKTAAANKGEYGHKIMQQLLEQDFGRYSRCSSECQAAGAIAQSTAASLAFVKSTIHVTGIIIVIRGFRRKINLH
ncbi:HET-domain-containing protein [Aspergillus alliaceus]|uniref:HET-domain-containing protein n=1 Tax=Petromyces alliaceus TaxID=209559 RepID=A0A5N7CJS1_PETAA|nr:HET-domain-containing protein [Aspergillus alliaceus]